MCARCLSQPVCEYASRRSGPNHNIIVVKSWLVHDASRNARNSGSTSGTRATGTKYSCPISAFSDLDHPAEHLMVTVSEWNAHAHPFNWSTQSGASVIAKCERQAVRVLAA